METTNIPWPLIAQKLAALGKKPAWLAVQLRTGTNTITNWKKRGGAPLSRVREIADVLQCTADDLLLSPSEMQHISAPADIPNNEQKAGMITASPTVGRNNLTNVGARKFDQNVQPAPLGQRRIPVISYVQAGMMTEAVDPFALGDGLETILTDLDVSEQTFALIIEGPSMLPEFNEGDKVIIDPMLSPRPGDYVVAKNTEEEVTFKKYRPRGTGEHGEMVFELVPLNDDFPTLNSARDHLRIIGVMVEHRKYRKR